MGTATGQRRDERMEERWTDNTIKTILLDREDQEAMNLWGDDCDRKDWEKFYARVETEL